MLLMRQQICSRRPIKAPAGVFPPNESAGLSARSCVTSQVQLELELELIQTQMAQKPMLRAEVYAHAMRASQNRKKEVRREKKV